MLSRVSTPFLEIAKDNGLIGSVNGLDLGDLIFIMSELLGLSTRPLTIILSQMNTMTKMEMDAKMELQNSDLIVDRYKKEINNDYKIIGIGHGQGVLFANSFYEELYKDSPIKTQSYGVVGVGSLAGKIKDNSNSDNYITLKEDIVWQITSTAYPFSTLPANETANTCFYNNGLSDIRCHSFKGTYISDKNEHISGMSSKDKIFDDIIRVGRGLENPKKEWNIVDFHYEDDGTCEHKIDLEYPELSEYLTVYPFNLNGNIYPVKGNNWVVASCGGKEVIENTKGWDGIENYDCSKLEGADEVIKCNPSKPSPWIVTNKYDEGTCDYRVDVTNSETGESQSSVYPFNESGYVYDVNDENVMANCNGTEIADLTQNGTDECYLLEGTGEIIEVEPTPTPTPECGEGEEQIINNDLECGDEEYMNHGGCYQDGSLFKYCSGFVRSEIPVKVEVKASNLPSNWYGSSQHSHDWIEVSDDLVTMPTYNHGSSYNGRFTYRIINSNLYMNFEGSWYENNECSKLNSQEKPLDCFTSLNPLFFINSVGEFTSNHFSLKVSE